MKLRHGLVQIPSQPRDGLRADRLLGEQRHDPPYGPRTEPAQESLANQEHDFRRSTRYALEPYRQKGLLARPGHPHSQRP